MSVDYWFFKKEYIGKQIDYKTPHISVEGYLIDNNSYWCEEYGLPPLPIRSGNDFDNQTLKMYEENIDENIKSLQFWKNDGIEFLKKLDPSTFKSEAMKNSYEDLLHFIPKIL